MGLEVLSSILYQIGQGWCPRVRNEEGRSWSSCREGCGNGGDEIPATIKAPMAMVGGGSLAGARASRVNPTPYPQSMDGWMDVVSVVVDDITADD